MSFLKSIFGKKAEPINPYKVFWDWFQKNEKGFYRAIKEDRNIEQDFFNKLSPKLDEIKDRYYYLTGMFNDNTVELILTADGAIKNIAFVEELVSLAPKIDNWIFTVLKPASYIENACIEMAGYKFNGENLYFYANDHADYPDEIDITVVHNDFNSDNKSTITNGTYIFLDNFIGELNFATTIDSLTVGGNDDTQKELMPIEKLKDYLIWRQKEFIEKYEGVRRNTENDNHSILKAELESGNALLAVINTDLLEWDGKASHPWILKVEIKL